MKEKIDVEELYYLLMSSWIYSIEKTSGELLGDNIAYTRRLGWNASEYIKNHLTTICDADMVEKSADKNVKDILEEIINCLENLGFIKKDTVSLTTEGDKISISITECRADACKQLIQRGIVPKVCLRSIVILNFLESIVGREFTYTLDADPESQPKGTCTSYIGETVE